MDSIVTRVLEAVGLLAGTGDGPLSVRRHSSTVNGASRFLRKWPPATIDRGASVPPPARNQGPGTSLPGPDAGHPLHAAGGHGDANCRARPQTTCPLRARSTGRHRVITVTPRQPATPAELHKGRLTRCANRPSKQRVSRTGCEPSQGAGDSVVPGLGRQRAGRGLTTRVTAGQRSDTCSLAPSAGTNTPCSGKNVTSGCPGIPSS
jgi:hypothetical protein